MRHVSPAVITVDEGSPVRLEFQIAVSSNGATWFSEGIEFFFTNVNGERNFVEFSPNLDGYPQNYVMELESVTHSDAGNYTASVFSKLLIIF